MFLKHNLKPLQTFHLGSEVGKLEPRKAEVEIEYEGVNISQDIAPFFISLTYSDHGTGLADDLQITLSDREGKWKDPWMPEDGDKINASIVLHNWYSEGSKHVFKCGTFSVDTLGFTGPPDFLDIKAISLSPASRLKNEDKTKSWEKVTLSQISSSITSAAGMKLMFETDDVYYDRIDQTEESDIAFLSRLARNEGISIKVTNDTIVIFDDRKYESIEPVRTLTRGESDIKSYSFDRSTVDVAYSSCEVSYFDDNTKTKITGTFRDPNVKNGPVLKINERVSSIAEATRKARSRLRQKNKEAQKATFVVMGDIALVQGVTVMIKGFGKFDAKYFVETATQTVGRSGYQTSIELRKVLGY